MLKTGQQRQGTLHAKSPWTPCLLRSGFRVHRLLHRKRIRVQRTSIQLSVRQGLTLTSRWALSEKDPFVSMAGVPGIHRLRQSSKGLILAQRHVLLYLLVRT
ncbi:hypothetical protein V2G26_003582 [Clonostachys chloroleuca]